MIFHKNFVEGSREIPGITLTGWLKGQALLVLCQEIETNPANPVYIRMASVLGINSRNFVELCR